MHADYTENKWFSMCTEFSTEVGITAWPHHWMFTAVTVLVPSACALASCMEQHFTSGMHSMSDLWSFPRPFIRRVYSYISLPVKSKAAICDGVGWLVGWRPTNLCVPNICIIPLIYNPTIQLCRWNLQHYIEIDGVYIICLGHIIPSWVGVLGTSPDLANRKDFYTIALISSQRPASPLIIVSRVCCDSS